jgi:asparagine synthase (glutamine-hydrolysing)
MSGIMGLYHPNLHPVAVQDLQQMMKALAHRGSDDSGYWAEGNIGLAHCMDDTRVVVREVATS